MGNISNVFNFAEGSNLSQINNIKYLHIQIGNCCFLAITITLNYYSLYLQSREVMQPVRFCNILLVFKDPRSSSDKKKLVIRYLQSNILATNLYIWKQNIFFHNKSDCPMKYLFFKLAQSGMRVFCGMKPTCPWRIRLFNSLNSV